MCWTDAIHGRLEALLVCTTTLYFLGFGATARAQTLGDASFTVSDIRVEGLERVAEGKVYNHLPVNIGDTLSPQRVREAIRALYATGFFRDVQLRRNGNSLIVAVLERPSIESFEITGNKDIKTEDLQKSLRNVGLATGKTFDRSVLEEVKQYLTFITAPEGQITSAEKLATLAFGQKTGTTKLKLFKRADVTDDTAALIVDFTVELRDPANGDVLFNSGKQRLTEKTRLLWAVVNNEGPGPAKVKVLGLDGATGTFLSTTDQAAVRAVHVSPDSGAFDIYRDSSLNAPVALDLAFRDTSPYSQVPTGDVDLIALPASATGVTILFVEAFSAITNTSYNAYTVGRQARSTYWSLLMTGERADAEQVPFPERGAKPERRGPSWS